MLIKYKEKLFMTTRPTHLIFPWDIDENLQQPFHKGIMVYRIFFEYLRLSPSFLYAHKFEKNLLTDEEKENPPVEFELVLQTYQDFKEVYDSPFWHWWSEYGCKLFDLTDFNDCFEPTIKKVAAIKYGQIENNAEYSSKLESYLENRDMSALMRNELLVSIPIDFTMSSKDIIKQFRIFIDNEITKIQNEQNVKELYKLHPCKFRLDSLEMGLKVIMAFTLDSSLRLYQVGQQVMISKIHRDLDIPKKYDAEEYGKKVESLKVMTIRAEKKGLIVMENAVRGRFPCFDNIEIPVIHYEEIGIHRRALYDADRKWYLQFKESLSPSIRKLIKQELIPKYYSEPFVQ